MKHGITLDQVYDAMRAGGPQPGTDRAGMMAALRAANLWEDGQPVRIDIALSAYGLLGPAGSAESDMQRALEAVAEFAAPKQARAEVTISEVRQALRDWLPESGGFIKMGDAKLLRLLRERLFLDFTLSGAAGQPGQTDHYARRRFEGQVSRVLNGLAGDGTLRKVGAGTRGPTGQVTGQHEAWFYTPEAWDEAERATAKRKNADRAMEARAGEALDGLDKLGVYARPRSEWIYLSLEGAERLLEMVHANRSLPTHVTFAHPDAGYEAARAKACAALEPGQAYILKTLRVERSYSTVELATAEGVPVPGQFGSEFFEIHEPGHPG
jgi:hypothetical protein